MSSPFVAFKHHMERVDTIVSRAQIRNYLWPGDLANDELFRFARTHSGLTRDDIMGDFLAAAVKSGGNHRTQILGEAETHAD